MNKAQELAFGSSEEKAEEVKGPSPEEALLAEIRDLLKEQNQRA